MTAVLEVPNATATFFIQISVPLKDKYMMKLSDKDLVHQGSVTILALQQT
jgi:hypothetical protein